MRSTQQFSVTLPNEMAQMVKNKVSSGEYASESEVVREGLRALQARDKVLETWLHTEVAAAYDELGADPSRALSAEQVRQHLAEKRNRSASAWATPSNSPLKLSIGSMDWKPISPRWRSRSWRRGTSTPSWIIARALHAFPHRGARRDDIRPGLRTLGYRRRLTIAFEVAAETVNVIGIFYGGQDNEAALRVEEE